MSMFPTEQQVMDLWDAGWTTARIAAEIGNSEDHVAKIVGRYAGTDEHLFNQMVKLGSMQLLAALRRHHPNICDRGGAA